MRSEEVESLQSIYPDNIEILEEIQDQMEDITQRNEKVGEDLHTRRGAFTIKIEPHTVEENNFCWVAMFVKYKAGYPNVIPEIKLLQEKSKGLTEGDF